MSNSISKSDISPTEMRDKQLWKTARRRAAFKTSLLAYFTVNTFLIAIWYFTSGVHSYFWPKWPLMGWGIGLTFQYLGAYHSLGIFSVEREYEKLKQQDR